VSYQEKLKAHLSAYKRSHLGIDEPGTFHYRGRELRYHHILPLGRGNDNLLDEARPSAEAWFGKNPGARHRYFHHLNSSQAFAFNLFFPFFGGGPEASAALLRALGQQGDLLKWELESVPVTTEGSNIDVSWTRTDSIPTICEVKLSEMEFGTAKDDSRHRQKFEEVYLPVLASCVGSACLVPQVFFSGYQFYRNVWHMAQTPTCELTFLLARSNEGLCAKLEHLLETVDSRVRGRISAVAIEDVLSQLTTDPLCLPAWRGYAAKLQNKYVIGN